MTIRKLFALVALLCVPCACAGLTPLKVKRNSVPPLAVTGVKHVVLVILENGSPKTAAKQDFMKMLEKNGTRLDQYFAVAHPSQPNYIALISGRAKDALNDDPIALDRPHLGRMLGKRWKVYADGYPAVAGKCFLGKESGVHRKAYVRRHVPSSASLTFRRVTARKLSGSILRRTRWRRCAPISPMARCRTSPF